MCPIDFLDLDDILRIHRNQIGLYGGDHGLRDAGLLRSATATPRQTFDGTYLHPDIFEMAAAYLFSIICDRPFVDGNKRTGVVAAMVFLGLNGVEVDVDDDLLAEFVLQVARGVVDRPAVATFLREHAI